MTLKVFTAGEVLTAADVNQFLVNTIFAKKTATESVTSSTTLQDDNHLTMTVEANSTYELSCVLIYDAATASGLKIAFAGPTGFGFNGIFHDLSSATTTKDDEIDYLTDAGSTASGLGSGTTLVAQITGLLTIGGTAGTFKLQWAQSSSGGTATRLFADSYICLRQVA